MAAAVLLVAGCATQKQGRKWGEYGGNLHLLKASYSAPCQAQESNHYIDLIEGVSVQEMARARNLTNNNALFVFSHGKAVETPIGRRYAFQPSRKGEQPPRNAASFSPSDLARTIGRENAGRIHNLVLAGCNTENLFYPQELRLHFPAVTNIIHAAPNTDAYEDTFRHVLTLHSSDIKAVYRNPEAHGVVRLGNPSDEVMKRRRLVPYMASLYLPGARKPYSVQVAGRELLTN